MSTPRRIEQLAIASLSDEQCPTSDTLAACILGELDGSAQLQVAAHVRGCPLCQQLAAICAPPPLAAPHASRKPQIASLITDLPALGLRGDGGDHALRRYIVADVTIELNIPPPDGERWQIVGQVLRSGLGLPFCPVQIRAGRRRPISQQSDSDGFFRFGNLPAGVYRLSVEHSAVHVEIESLVLGTDD